MHPPAVAVTRMLYGSGIGVLLGVGFALQSGHTIGREPSAQLGFLLLALLMLLSAWSLSRGIGPLAQRFSDETDGDMAKRVKAEIHEVQRSEHVSSKWAHLEAKVLTKEIGEEE